MANTIYETTRFILSLSVIANSSIILTLVFCGLQEKNIRLIYLLLALVAYPATMYIYITDPNLSVYQLLTGSAGIFVAATAVYFLYNFPRKKKTTTLHKIFYSFGVLLLWPSIKPGFWPNAYIVGNVIRSDISWTAYLLALYIVIAIIIISCDAFTNQQKKYSGQKRHLFKYFIAFAIIATILDVIIPAIWKDTSTLLTSFASASSLIFSIGLYAVYKKTKDHVVINHQSFTQLLTIFLVLLSSFYLSTTTSIFWPIRFVIILISLKVGYDTLIRINNEQKEHEELKEIHLANMEYISDLAHRLKTPLAIIQSQSNSVNRSKKLAQQTLNDINRVAGTTISTMRNIVSIGKIDAELTKIKARRTNLSELITKWQPDFKALIQQHYLATKIESDCLVNVDSNLIKEVIINLLDNARKYSPNKSTITINLHQTKNSVNLIITDQGIGIKRTEINYIFDRHWQSRRRLKEPGSAGLGLSLVKWIVQQHKGEIEVVSRPKHGTTFIIKLPLHQKEIVHKQVTRQIVEEPAS